MHLTLVYWRQGWGRLVPMNKCSKKVGTSRPHPFSQGLSVKCKALYAKTELQPVPRDARKKRFDGGAPPPHPPPPKKKRGGSGVFRLSGCFCCFCGAIFVCIG